ncbi:hypothetical protein FOYG_02017 [Fusarium oxysporum NRRL 32931]|uniref:Heterokaryon incompatibility domain-containing protein n=1 Tax=Fusarium oxysporum NRRL 32931 TaxID=660029 RepID=W9J692_FUSOX|nr:hypothetical protein FOYG_02017 [Fusarium oxysporum NRRL 32931]
MNNVTFKHKALDDPAENIRLVQVKAPQTALPLQLCLSTHLIANNLRYFAVSYTWGDGCLTEELLINGRPMMVTKNCYYALTQINSRYPSDQNSQEPAYIWIDSICINQDDNDEKGYQVAMMGDIYSKAAKVLACIGSHADNSQMLRTVLDEIKVLKPRVYADREVLRSGMWSDYGEGRSKVRRIQKFLRSYPPGSPMFQHKFGVQFRKACLEFANRSYWSRVWVIQEFTAPSRSGNDLEILCGCDTFSKPELNLCYYIALCISMDGGKHDVEDVNLLRSSLSTPAHSFQTLMRFNALDPVPLGSILLYIRDLFHCTKTEDKVYGLLSLIKWPVGVAPIQPVYKPSTVMDLAELLISVTDELPNNIQEILRALDIYHDHHLLRSLVETRTRHPSELSSRHGKYSPRASQTRPCVLPISLNDVGQLSASLRLIPQNRLGFNGVAAHRIQRANRSFDTAQPLFAGSDVAALLCGAAQQEDVIIQIQPLTKLLLVLRPNEHVSQYDVVGQGLLVSRYEFPQELPLSVGALEHMLERLETEKMPESNLFDPKQYKESLKMQLEEACQPGQGDLRCLVEFRAEPIEWLILIGQDLAKNAQRDTERVLERLYTKINMEVTMV